MILPLMEVLSEAAKVITSHVIPSSLDVVSTSNTKNEKLISEIKHRLV